MHKNTTGILRIIDSVQSLTFRTMYNINCSIRNCAELSIEEFKTYVPGDDFMMEGYSNHDRFSVVNERNGHMTIKNVNSEGGIRNQGVIELMKNCTFKSKKGIENSGTIKYMEKCKMMTDSLPPTHPDYNKVPALKNIGRIGKILSCEFISENGAGAQLISGEINSISQCTFIGTNAAIICDDEFELVQKLNSGTFPI